MSPDPSHQPPLERSVRGEDAPAEEIRLPVDEPVGALLSFEVQEPSARGLVRSGAMVSAVVVLSNAFNVLFHFGTARLLGRDEYSLLTTMFAVFLVGTVPLLAVQATVTREMSALLSEGREHDAALVLRSSLRAVLRASLFVLAIAIVLFVPLLFVLKIDRLLPVLAVSFAFIVQVPQPVAGAGLSATERFGVMSWTQVLQMGLKLAAGLGLAALGLGASAITFGVGFAIAVGVGVSFLVMRPMLRAASGHPLPAQRVIGRYALGAAIILGANTMLTQTDLIWARATLSADEAGLYAAASVLSSCILIIPIGVTTVLFPRVAKLRDHRSGDRYLQYGTGAVAVLSAVVVGVMAAIPVTLIHLTLGNAYDAAAGWLWSLGIAMALYAILIVYVNHFLAQGRTGVVWVLLGGLAVQQTLFFVLHGSGLDIVIAQIVASAVTLLSVAIYDRLTLPPSEAAEAA